MATTQYFTATSIDGFVADSDNSLDWLMQADAASDRADEGGVSAFAAFFARVGAFAMGATTHEWVVENEDLRRHPEKWTEWYGDVPAWVFSHRQLPPDPGARITWVSGDVRHVHEAMTAAAGGKHIWIVGGGDLAGAFADAFLLASPDGPRVRRRRTSWTRTSKRPRPCIASRCSGCAEA